MNPMHQQRPNPAATAAPTTAIAPRHADARMAQVIDFFEHLQPQDLARLDAVYAQTAYFRDPFHEVRGIEAVRAVFEHMFESLNAPRFVVREAMLEGDQGFLVWDFVFESPRLGAGPQTLHGSTHVRFDAQGLVSWHRDYWDAAEELYARVPWLGALMRWLQRQLASSAALAASKPR